ncbi:trna (guanine-n -)-methyltransferase [Colletotrichum incanum]|uniref:tRNA (guanine(9)-N1)-methyltransferase n=1 Tax=Colletotrichum incanum TaxID=1573173 RepID=A0A167C9M6_COLIC|nr:trna (guanine-n -)-methyltransferase [Colletotrichum incanum]OHW99789.1 tRNA (guanine-n-)-methyltransferase [Colletotrichum incanum]
MENPASEPVNHPAKDLEMSDVKTEGVTVTSTTANGDGAAAAGAAAAAPNPTTRTTETTSSGVNQTDAPEASEEKDGEVADVESSTAGPGSAVAEGEPKLSKNQLRKMKRKAAWEDGREDRKRKRKEKRHDRQAARREEIAAALAEAEAKGIDPASVVIPPKRKTPKQPSTQVPVTLIIDCDFEKYMLEKELVSLASQITRSYSDNRAARYRAHLYVSSYGGQLKERFETTLGSQHVHWKGVKLVEGDFVEASKDADELMKGPRGGQVINLLKPTGEDGATKKPAVFRDVLDSAPSPDPEPEPADELKNIVYLSSDSVNTLDRLEPNTSYVIGGLVDRNREKGLCHRRAREMGIRTAKLPIGEYMNLSSRRVLATNHVVEIMLKWLETGSWAEAFLSVIPKRKEAKLKEEGGAGSTSGTPAVEGADGEIEDSRFEDEDDEDVDEKQTITENVAAPESSAAAQDSAKEAVSAS